jgi:hypothetical protein
VPGVHKVMLIGQEVIASHLGVTSQCISNWYKRETEDIQMDRPAWGMPVHIEVEYRPGKAPGKVWRKAQLTVWAKWYARHLAEQGDHIPGSRKVA